jgi:hypothetical protein
VLPGTGLGLYEVTRQGVYSSQRPL